MKSIVNRLVGFVLIATLTGVVALAKNTEREVTFTKSLTVNGTQEGHLQGGVQRRDE